MTAEEYRRIRSTRSTAPTYTPTPVIATNTNDCEQAAAVCLQERRFPMSRDTDLSACIYYDRYCNDQTVTPISYEPIECRNEGTCAYGNSCPHGTSCTGYPDYTCLTDACFQLRLYQQPIYSHVTYQDDDSWWQPIIIPPAPPLPGITPSPGIPAITPSPGIPSITPAPGIPAITPAPPIPGITPAPSIPAITPAPPIPTDPVTYEPDPASCVCYQIYDPVCARNGVTYPNDCYARCAGQDILVRGTCQVTLNDQGSFLR